MAADVIAGLIGYLAADPGVLAKVAAADRIFGAELPRTFNAQMPAQAALVLRPAGGYGRFGSGTLPLGDPRIATDCYGPDEYASWLLYLAVLDAMRALQRRRVAGVLLHSASVGAGGVTGRDPQTNWPLTIATYTVIASELAD